MDIRTRTFRQNGNLVIIFEDYGGGIAADFCETLFEPGQNHPTSGWYLEVDFIHPTKREIPLRVSHGMRLVQKALAIAAIAFLMIPMAMVQAVPYYDNKVRLDANPVGIFSGRDSTITYELFFDMGQKNQTLSVRSLERQYDFEDNWTALSGGGNIKNGQFLRIPDQVNASESVPIGAHTLTLRFEAKLANETSWSEMEKSMTIYVQKQVGNEFSGWEVAVGAIIAGCLAILFYHLIRRERPSK